MVSVRARVTVSRPATVLTLTRVPEALMKSGTTGPGSDRSMAVPVLVMRIWP